jgi:DNA repair exonuclease SbcCD ATPase subunit
MVKMRRDESVTTSLRELADLEEQREQDKKRAHAAAVQAGERARQQAEREALEAEEQRRRAEARLADERVRVAQDEMARRTAMHSATLEETRQRLRLQEAEALHRQTLESTRALREAQGEGRKHIAGGFALGLVLSVAGASAVLFGYALPRAARAEAQVQSLTLDQSAAADRALRDSTRITKLEADLAATVAKYEKALKDLDDLRLATRPQGKAGVATTGSRAPVRNPGPVCQDGDPMCGTLPGQRP